MRRRGPGAREFAPVATVWRKGGFEAVDLPAGRHEFVVVGMNSRGAGPASEAMAVTVADAA